MTGLNNIAEMNDILVECRAGGVADPFRASARSHFVNPVKDKRSMSRKVLRVITVPILFTCQGCTPNSCMILVSYSPVMSLKEHRPLQTTCRNSCQIAKHHRLSINSIYILIMDSLKHIPFLLRVQRVAFSWCQEHLARILDVSLDLNCIHRE